jgi:transcriptional repressor BetI
MSQPAYSRAEPDARRLSLIEAAARVLAERGASGISVRHVAVAAGVSPGLVGHYFEGIDALIAQTYVHVAARVTDALRAATNAAGEQPQARLHAYVAANFARPIADPDLLATWIAFWSLVRTNAEIARLHDLNYAAFRADIADLLQACDVVGEDARHRSSIAITALIDGLWLELCLSPNTLTAEVASAIARQHIEAVLVGTVRTILE